jgi:hypothetical protein
MKRVTQQSLVAFTTALLLAPLAIAGDAPRNSGPGVLVPDKVQRAYAFDLNQVHLLDGPFKRAQELDRQYLLKLDLDLLLYPFRREAGLPSPMTGPDALGYETTGHYLGHYLSACALMVRNTGDAELKRRADSAVAVLARCQAKLGTGFVMGFPERGILQLARLDVQPGEQPLHVGVPWYCIHKVYAGLLDMYLLTGNRQALDVLEKSAQWTGKILGRLDDAHVQGMLQIEHGGMNEVLANLYAVTGNEEYLKMSLRFNHRAVMDHFAKGEDPLDRLHANTQIPKFTGVARQAALTGDPTLRTIAVGFWDHVTRERSYVAGGNSEEEHFSPKARLSEHVHAGTQETCNSYNMLKLTRCLFCQEPQAAYADYYERTLLNHILSSQHPQTGAMLYFEELESGRPKAAGWSDPNRPLPCCHGTGLESHAKYADSIYFHDGRDGLFVNQFIASELAWKDKALTLRQETRYPDEPSTRLLFTCEKPLTLTVNLRRPWWASSGFQLLFNGEPLEIASMPGSFVPVKRTWQSGAVLEVRMRMTFRTEGFADNPKRVAVMYGPLVMAALTDEGNRFSAIRTENDRFLASLKPVPGKPLEFSAPATIFRTSPLAPGGKPVCIRPLLRMVNEPKVVYWDICDAQGYERLLAALREKEARRKAWEADIAPRTIDRIEFEPKSETAHKLQSKHSGRGVHRERPWRDAKDGGYFAFQLKVLSEQSQKLLVTYWGSDGGNREFDILVDGRKIARQKLTGSNPDDFFDVAYPIPADLLAGKEAVTVRFEPLPGKMAGGAFGCRILKK